VTAPQDAPAGPVHHITAATLAALDPAVAERARRLATERQRLAHDGTGYLPAWDDLTADEQAQGTVEASHWLEAFGRLDSSAGPVLSEETRRPIRALLDEWLSGAVFAERLDLLTLALLDPAGPIAALVSSVREEGEREIKAAARDIGELTDAYEQACRDRGAAIEEGERKGAEAERRRTVGYLRAYAGRLAARGYETDVPGAADDLLPQVQVLGKAADESARRSS
jgi:hypothetical protein